MKHKHISRRPPLRGAAALAGAFPVRACGKNGGKSSTPLREGGISLFGDITL